MPKSCQQPLRLGSSPLLLVAQTSGGGLKASLQIGKERLPKGTVLIGKERLPKGTVLIGKERLPKGTVFVARDVNLQLCAEPAYSNITEASHYAIQQV